jgi:hypothetical protein
MYTLSKTGVTLNGMNIPNDPRNRHWKEYQAWLKDGNTPAPMPAAEVLTIDAEYDRLSDWMKELIKISGANLVALKAAVVARRNQ